MSGTRNITALEAPRRPEDVSCVAGDRAGQAGTVSWEEFPFGPGHDVARGRATGARIVITSSRRTGGGELEDPMKRNRIRFCGPPGVPHGKTAQNVSTNR
jgi:hypothetical protein